MDELWAEVDEYLTDLVVGRNPSLDELQRAADRAGLPHIQVSPAHGKLLHLLARMVGASRVLEIGTLGGYSTAWLAAAVEPDGFVLSLELDAHHAEVARSSLAHLGYSDVVEVRVGPALDSLSRLAFDDVAPFDLVFVDADKKSIPEYVEWAVQLSRPGTVIVIDNVVRGGAVIDGSSDDENVQGVRRLNQMLAEDERLDATTIQTVGGKGYDGFTLALVK